MGAFTFFVDNFFGILTPPSLFLDCLYTETYVLEQTFVKPFPHSFLSTQNVKAPCPKNVLNGD